MTLQPIRLRDSRTSLWNRPASILAFMLLCAFVMGCTSGESTQSATTKPQNSKKESRLANVEQNRLCRANFEKIYEILEPSSQNINNELQSALVLLNDWFVGCAEFQEISIDPHDSLFENFESPDSLTELNKQTASLHDVYYLRDQLLLQRISEHLTVDVTDELEKVRRLFDFVQRNVTVDQQLIDRRLVPIDLYARLSTAVVPRSMQDILLSGRCRPEERILLFANLLQQINRECLLLQPQSTAGGNLRVPGLIIVPIGDATYICCPELGVEISAGSGDQFELWKSEQLTASLDQVVASFDSETTANDSLASLLTVAAWDDADLLLPVCPIAMSRRMEVLQYEFTLEQTCDVYRQVRTVENQPGMLDQIQDRLAGVVGTRPVRVWEYPHEFYRRLVDETEDQRKLRELTMATLYKEVNALRTSENQNEERTYEVKRERKLLEARIEQLVGNLTLAVRTFMRLRLQQAVPGSTEQARYENAMRTLQAEDAHFWSGMTQFEKGQFESAAQTFESYCEIFTNGRWEKESRRLWAEALSKNGDPTKAIEILEAVSAPPYSRFRQARLLRDWKEESTAADKASKDES